MTSGGSRRSILPDEFLEQYAIRSEVGEGSGSDPDEPDIESEVAQQHFDRRFSEDSLFRNWVLKRTETRGNSLRAESLRRDARVEVDVDRACQDQEQCFQYRRSANRNGPLTDHHPPPPDLKYDSASSALLVAREEPRLSRGATTERPGKSQHLFLKPPKFDGKSGSVESHLAQFSIVAQRNSWDDGEMADYLMCSLSGEASNILKDLPCNPTYTEVVTSLRQHYASVDQVEAYRAQLKNRRRKPGESLQDLMKDIRRLFLSAYPRPY